MQLSNKRFNFAKFADELTYNEIYILWNSKIKDEENYYVEKVITFSRGKEIEKINRFFFSFYTSQIPYH